MTLHALEMPDDPVQLPVWLERQLVSLDLARLVAELLAIHGPSPDGPSLAEILGEYRDSVLASGLRRLPAHLLGYLLLRPPLLFELQELVLSEGSEYWDGIAPASADHSERISRGGQRLQAYLAGQGVGSGPSLRVFPESSQLLARPTVGTPLAANAGWYRSPWFVSLATAATLLFGVFVYNQSFRSAPTLPVASAGTTWGWARPGAINESLPADQYLTALVLAAGEWFDERPESPADLARRIGEFRQGCSILLLSITGPWRRRTATGSRSDVACGPASSTRTSRPSNPAAMFHRCARTPMTRSASSWTRFALGAKAWRVRI